MLISTRLLLSEEDMPAEAVPPPAEAVQPPETEAVSATPNRSRTDHPLPTLTNMNQRWYQWGTRGKEYQRQAAIASNCSHLRYTPQRDGQLQADAVPESFRR